MLTRRDFVRSTALASLAAPLLPATSFGQAADYPNQPIRPRREVGHPPAVAEQQQDQHRTNPMQRDRRPAPACG